MIRMRIIASINRVGRYRPLICTNRQCVRLFSQPPKPDKADDYDFNKSVKEYIHELNTCIETYPLTSALLFVAIRNATWSGLAMLYASQSFGSELAVGYLVAKLTGKFRQPVNLALAAALSHQFKWLSEVKIAPLFTGDLKSLELTEEQKKQTGEAAKINQYQEKMLGYLKSSVEPIEKYGFAFFLAGRINVSATIICTAVALRYGVDMSSFLQSIGISESMQSGAGALGAATLTNICLLPIHFGILTAVTPLVGTYAQLGKTLVSKKKFKSQ